jgi:hypothetical protein
MLVQILLTRSEKHEYWIQCLKGHESLPICMRAGEASVGDGGCHIDIRSLLPPGSPGKKLSRCKEMPLMKQQRYA